MSSNEPMKNGCEVIYETFHISLHMNEKRSLMPWGLRVPI